MHAGTISGADLRAHRKAAKLTQAELAKRAGFTRDAVCYWEAKDRVPLRGCAPAAFAKVLGLPENVGLSHHYARARGWGVSDWRENLDALAEVQFALWKIRHAQRQARLRVTCAAKTRAGGKCRNKSEPGKRRCKFHGGKSTGAKTPEGKARIAEAQRRRWAAYHAALGGKATQADPTQP